MELATSYKLTPSFRPNSVLSQSKISNYFYPEKELSMPVELGVHYNFDLEQIA
ncbi:MAG: hypothetical protein WDZ52_08755 [Pseudohongiellaceae bacterium]